MTLWLTTGGKYHVPARIDHRRDFAVAECERLDGEPVEADPDPGEVCDDCREARPHYVDPDEA